MELLEVAGASNGNLGGTFNGHSRRSIRCSIKVQYNQLLKTIVKLKDGPHVCLKATHDASGTNIPIPADQITVKSLEISLQRDNVLYKESLINNGFFSLLHTTYHSHRIINGVNLFSTNYCQMYFDILLIEESHNLLLQELGGGIVQLLFDIHQGNLVAIDLKS